MKKDKDWFLTFMMWIFVFIFCFGIFVAYSIGKPICDYSSNVMTTYKGQIDKYVVESRQVFPYYEDTKKCVVTIQAKVQKKWYAETADYIYTPDMSQNEACSNAITKAKENILNMLVPEMLEGKKQLSCDLTIQKNSCTMQYMNVVMPDLGLQEVKLKQCNR